MQRVLVMLAALVLVLAACGGDDDDPVVEGGSDTAPEDGGDAKLGTITRDDGSTQVSYNGHPLYYYAPDQNPGDTTGQGVNDVWFVVSPAGDAVESSAASEPSGY